MVSDIPQPSGSVTMEDQQGAGLEGTNQPRAVLFEQDTNEILASQCHCFSHRHTYGFVLPPPLSPQLNSWCRPALNTPADTLQQQNELWGTSWICRVQMPPDPGTVEASGPTPWRWTNKSSTHMHSLPDTRTALLEITHLWPPVPLPPPKVPRNPNLKPWNVLLNSLHFHVLCIYVKNLFPVGHL